MEERKRVVTAIFPVLGEPPATIAPGEGGCAGPVVADFYLDEAARETPVVAIGAAAREALRLADMLEAMLLAARDAFVTDDRKRVAEVRQALRSSGSACPARHAGETPPQRRERSRLQKPS